MIPTPTPTPPPAAPAPVPAAPAPSSDPSSRGLVAATIGGVALLGAGIALLLLGQHEAGAVLTGAGAAELGVKGVALRG